MAAQRPIFLTSFSMVKSYGWIEIFQKNELAVSYIIHALWMPFVFIAVYFLEFEMIENDI